jgi:hypothetical protein
MARRAAIGSVLVALEHLYAELAVRHQTSLSIINVTPWRAEW